MEPPIDTATAIPFSNASFVRMSRGLIPCSSSLITVRPASYDFCSIPSSTAGSDDAPGSAIPMASMVEDMVLAVNIPPHDPAPGHAAHSISFKSESLIRPLLCAPMASKTSWMLMSFPAYLPGMIVPL